MSVNGEGYYEAPRFIRGWYPSSMTINHMETKAPMKIYNIPEGWRYQWSYFQEEPLSGKNYYEWFKFRLYMEEEKMKADINNYNMVSRMYRDRTDEDLLVLEVPGVPTSLLRGDWLVVTPWDTLSSWGHEYQGYVHQVGPSQVKLGFSRLLDRCFYDGMWFQVKFRVNRMTLRIQHRAAEQVSQRGLQKVLFPSAITCQQKELSLLSLFDKRLNPEQYLAVQHIVAGSSKPAPYLVFGPPGTGKTVTVVEAIKQIEKTQGSSCHILACAPSNSAADLLCDKILEHVEERKVFRLYAKNYSGVPLQCFCNQIDDGFEIPSKHNLKRYQILVTTLLTVSRLVTGGLCDHYTHIFIDEAGRAKETESIIPLAGLLNPMTGQVVLAGDPKQLGPIVKCPQAREHGLGVSLFERLMKHFTCYQKRRGGFDERFVTKLQLNYRSHPVILQFPSERFYDNEVLPRAGEKKCNYYIGWKHLPNKDFPIIFKAVAGKDKYEGRSLSIFNQKEVQVLMDYVTKLLLTSGRYKIKPRNIGIITPYQKQVEKIRKQLHAVGRKLQVNMDDLKVSTVERFQSDERKVILVSTVRSNIHDAQQDLWFSRGFFNNDKKFNVAMTRAEALLIVVGNPDVLKIDGTWRAFIQYCCDGGGYIGQP